MNVLLWSGGKDSALALAALGSRVAALLTTLADGRVATHGVPVELVRAQARSAGLSLVEADLPPWPSNAVYEHGLAQALADPRLAGLDVAAGDLFLEDVRAYREDRLAALGRGTIFPLWGLDTRELAERFVREGYRAVIVCVDPRVLDASFAGREFDERVLRDLPPGVDPCGENGELHTFVYDGPPFANRVRFGRGEVSERDGLVYCDLAPA